VSPLACVLFGLGILCTIAAAVVELRRPDDPRIEHLQQMLAASRAENVKLIEMEVSKAAFIQKLKSYLDNIIALQKAGTLPGAPPAPPP